MSFLMNLSRRFWFMVLVAVSGHVQYVGQSRTEEFHAPTPTNSAPLPTNMVHDHWAFPESRDFSQLSSSPSFAVVVTWIAASLVCCTMAMNPWQSILSGASAFRSCVANTLIGNVSVGNTFVGNISIRNSYVVVNNFATTVQAPSPTSIIPAIDAEENAGGLAQAEVNGTANVEGLEAEIAALKDQLRHAEIENAAFKSKLADASKVHASEQQRSADNEQLLEVHKRLLLDAESDKTTLRGHIANAGNLHASEKQTLEEDLEALKRQLRKSDSEKKVLRSQLIDAANLHANEKQRLEDDAQALELALRVSKSDRVSLSARLDAAVEELVGEEQKSKDNDRQLQDQTRAAERSRDDFKRENEALRIKLNQSSAELETANVDEHKAWSEVDFLCTLIEETWNNQRTEFRLNREIGNSAIALRGRVTTFEEQVKQGQNVAVRLSRDLQRARKDLKNGQTKITDPACAVQNMGARTASWIERSGRHGDRHIRSYTAPPRKW